MSALLFYNCRKFVCNHTQNLKSFGLYKILAMPKDRSYITHLHENRYKAREKKAKYGTGTAYVQILGSGAPGAPKSVYVFSDYSKYLFNCGEGVQRLAHEHKIKISRLEHVFITHPSWKNIGGLPGLALTVQDVGVPDLALHGPEGIDSIFRATNKFIVLYNLTINMAKCDKYSVYEDTALTVQYVPLVNQASVANGSNRNENFDNILTDEKNDGDDIDYYAHMRKKIEFSNNSEWIKPTSRYTTLSMAYICKLKPKQGALNLERCVEKGVQPGPLLGKLKNGEDVTLPDGRVVLSSEVKEPDCPGPVFIVLDCPSTDFLDTLLCEEAFVKHQAGGNESDLAKIVLHFTPSEIVKHEKYQTWMQRFPETTTHVYVNDSNTCMGNVGAHVLAHQLNYLDSDIFPLLNDRSIPIVDVPLNKKHVLDYEEILKRGELRANKEFDIVANRVKQEDLNFPPEVGHTLKIIDLRPSKNADQTRNCVFMNPQSIIEDMNILENFKPEYDLLKSKLASISEQIKSENAKHPYPIITFLGTGSSIPNKTRNTSGILISFSANDHMIMDCGEGTYGQMVRHFGLESADEILANIKVIYVSHLHADHHIGAISLLQRRSEVVNKFDVPLKKVFLLAPEQIMRWFKQYHATFEDILDCFNLIPNAGLCVKNPSKPDYKQMLELMNLKEIRTTTVKHCPNSFGIAVIDSNDRKITYSGDTMPSENLVVLGQNSDLLIHEATFEDGLNREAKVKMHSTTSEAVDVGRRMNAKFTILTHFSQRYYKIPVVDEVSKDNVGIAFDNMRVRLGDLTKLPLFNSILKIIFNEEQELQEFRLLKKKRKLNQ